MTAATFDVLVIWIVSFVDGANWNENIQFAMVSSHVGYFYRCLQFYSLLPHYKPGNVNRVHSKQQSGMCDIAYILPSV